MKIQVLKSYGCTLFQDSFPCDYVYAYIKSLIIDLTIQNSNILMNNSRISKNKLREVFICVCDCFL